MPRCRRCIAIAALAVVLAVLAAGCGGDREALTVYSGRTQDLIGPLLEQYSDENDVAIDVRYGDTADLALLIAEEGDRSPADVFLSQSPGAVAFLDEQGLLAPIDAEVVAQVDPRFRAEDGSWVGVSARQRVLVYNEDLVEESELPDRVADLTAPEYRGRVAARAEQRLLPGLRDRDAVRRRGGGGRGVARGHGRQRFPDLRQQQRDRRGREPG